MNRHSQVLQQVEVRFPFPDSALPQLWLWCEKFRHLVADDYAPKDMEDFVNYELARSEQGGVKYGVYRADEIGGCIWVEPVNYRVVSAHCVFKKEFFGHQTTLPALTQVADYLFAQGVKKIQMNCFDHNAAIKSLLRKLGTVKEGILRQQTTQNGKPIDILLLALYADTWNSAPLLSPD